MAARFGKLPIDDSPRTRVFRCIDDILRSDPAVTRIFNRTGSFKSWRGEPSDKNPFAQDQAPAIRITPEPEGESQWFPGFTRGVLSVKIELLVGGLCVDDVENLHYVLVQALGPVKDNARCCELKRKLQEAGAVTGTIFWVMPAHDPDPEAGTDGQFHAYGRLRLEVETS